MNYAFADTAKKIDVNISSWDAIWSAGLVVQLTLLLLVSLSIVCWAIIVIKRKQFEHMKVKNTQFLDEFWKATSLDAVHNVLDQFAGSSLARIFSAGYQEMQRITDSSLAKSANDQAPLLKGIDNLERSLRKAADQQVSMFEERLTLLATTGSTGPFIGLFGTVWGIMSAFQKIGQTGAASLAVVAPGISEALIATAIGLAAAIPAVVAYNYFISQIRRQEVEINNFIADFLNIARRNFFKE